MQNAGAAHFMKPAHFRKVALTMIELLQSKSSYRRLLAVMFSPLSGKKKKKDRAGEKSISSFVSRPENK